MNTRPKGQDNLRNKALLFRVSSHVTLAIIAGLLPAVGPNRFLLAAALVCLGTPVAIIVNKRVQGIDRNWAEALVDLLLVVTLIHLTPHLWMVAMALGLMVALAPSISLHPRSHWIYMAFAGILLVGMTLAAVLHDVENWGLVILAVAATYPALLYYTFSQMQLANELRERAEMVKGMTQLAGSMAHDFNNMLMGISGHTEVALAKLPEDHQVRSNLNKVLDGTKRASLLTKRLLSFAGRDLGQKELVNLVSEFQQITALLQPILPADINIKLTNSDHALHVEANVTDLHQVVMNVLLNAGESMLGSEGEIDVHFSRIEKDTGAFSDEVTLLIGDRGKGISNDAMDKVFDPFFTTKKKGHGLGLAVCKRIMHQLNGSIEIRPRSGGGTEVLLTFPQAKQPEINPEAQIVSNPSAQASKLCMKILVVDDEPDVLSAAAGILKSQGHEAITANSADEALAIFTTRYEQISAVLLDLKMPNRDGWSCLQDIRNIAADKPVIICTGYNPAEKVPSFVSTDSNLYYLAKPFHAEPLAQVLKSI